MQVEPLVMMACIIMVNTLHPFMLIKARSNYWAIALGAVLMQAPWPLLHLAGVDLLVFLTKPFTVTVYMLYVAALYHKFMLAAGYKTCVFVVFSVLVQSYLVLILSYLSMVHMFSFSPGSKTFLLSRLTYIPISFLIFPFSYYVLRKRFAMVFVAVERQSIFVLLPLLLCLFLLCFTSSTLLYFYQGASVTFASLASALAVMAFYYALYSFVVKENEVHTQANRAEAAERLAQTYVFYDEELLGREKTIRALRHDFKHTLGLLAALAEQGDYAQIQSHINNVSFAADSIAASVYCENVVVNATVSYYFAEATTKGIHCSARAHVPAKLSMSGTELAMLLGNALGNCLKGAGPLGEMGYISFTAKPAKEYMVFTFANNYQQGSYEKGAGIGLHSLKSLCEKYEGTMQVEDSGAKDDEFRLTLIVRV